MQRPDTDFGPACLAVLSAGAAALAVGSPYVADAMVLGGYAALFVPWLALVASPDDGTLDPAQLRWRHLLGAAVVVRVVLLGAEPLLSDDVFRYVWDGRVAADGINPYSFAPAADALSHLRDADVWAHINHPRVPTIYPPVAQMLFRLNAALRGGDTVLRGLLLVVEALGMTGVWFALRHTGQSWTQARLKRAFTAYALCPLVAVEVAWSGHVDVVAWMALLVSLLLMVRARSTRLAAVAGVLFGISVAAKFLGLLALPIVLLAPRGPRRDESVRVALSSAIKRRTIFVLIAAALVGAAYMPYADAGRQLWAGFGAYASTWEGNDGPFRAAETLSKAALERDARPATDHEVSRPADKLIFRFPQYDKLAADMGWTRQWRGRVVPATSFAADQLAAAIAKAVAAFIVALAMLWAVLVRREPVGGMLIVLLALFFVAPVVHPWYVAWLVPLGAITRSRATRVFALVVLAAYLSWLNARAGGPAVVPAWVAAMEFGAVGAATWWDAIHEYVSC